MKKPAINPYLPSWEYIPDGEPYVFNGRVYVYGSHDIYNSHVFCLGNYVTYSAPVDDLGNWRYEGVIYEKTQDPENKEGKMCLYAPDMTIGPDGRYYLYYALDKIPIISVAVCDEPGGKFEFYGYVHYADGTRLGEKEGDEPQFDPGVLTEGDKTYLYTGFCGRGDRSRTGSRLQVLDKDMLTIIEEPKTVVPGIEYQDGTGFEGHAFFEASSIRKVGDKYYFIYSSSPMHEMCYATADDPRGPFKYGGVIVSNADIGISKDKPADMPVAYGGNDHGSIVEINGSWYIFYHRQTNGSWYSRQGCAEKIEIKADGSIPQVEMTSCGLNNGPLPGSGYYPAYLACNLFTDKPSVYVGGDQFPKVMQDGRDGDEEPGYIGFIRNSATAGFKYFDLKGVKAISINVRGYAKGEFEVRTSREGEVLAKIPVDFTNVWETYTSDIKIPDGVAAIFLTYKGSGTCDLQGFELIA
ncbi:MAG: family 43 glycosylhydrolase [Lachnospiraceae bacterium]|nr:family 43 glycosylhydrolase [Lachnospiraceae bacterium]